MYALNLGTDSRILSATFEQYASENMIKVETLPEGDITKYKYIDGEYVYDPLPEPEPVTPEPTQAEINAANIDYIAMMAGIELPEV